jgi:hypothetical protein
VILWRSRYTEDLQASKHVRHSQSLPEVTPLLCALPPHPQFMPRRLCERASVLVFASADAEVHRGAPPPPPPVWRGRCLSGRAASSSTPRAPPPPSWRCRRRSGEPAPAWTPGTIGWPADLCAALRVSSAAGALSQIRSLSAPLRLEPPPPHVCAHRLQATTDGRPPRCCCCCVRVRPRSLPDGSGGRAGAHDDAVGKISVNPETISPRSRSSRQKLE